MCIKREELEKEIKKFKKLEAKMKNIEMDIEKVKKEITDYMTENNLSEEITNAGVVSYKQQNRKTLDKDGLLEIFGDDLQPYLRVTFYNVLRIK